MKNIKKIIFILFLCVPLMVVNAEEKDLITNENEEVEIINDADYKAADTLNQEGNFFGNVFYAGNNVTSKSMVDGIGFLAGNNVTIAGVQDYLITAGNNIVVKGVVKKDAIIAGNTINIEGNVGRDMIIAGSSVIISGNIERNVKIYASEITIKGTIKGNVDISSTTINIEEGAVIEGYLNYNDTATLNKNENVIIDEIKTYQVVEEQNFGQMLKHTIYNFLTSYVNLLIVALVFTYLLPKVFVVLKEEFTNNKVDDYIRLFIKGLVFLVLVPVISLFLLVSSVGLSLGLIALALYFILSYISIILTGYIVGNLIWCKLLKKENNTYINLLIGIFVIKLFELVPFIGAVISILSLFIGLGIVVEKLIINKSRKQA